MRLILLIFWLALLFVPGMAQDLTGLWEGVLNQEGQPDSFLYRLNIQQDGNAISGASFSSTYDGQAYARFTVSGVISGDQLVLQEIDQYEPDKPVWCLKYASLQLIRKGRELYLEGKWRADKCTPGSISLRFFGSSKDTIIEKELPFRFAGKWTGFLSQSDRDYGFYFELDLDDAPKGSSYIVSEGNGGTATHELQWSLDTLSNKLSFQETAIGEKTDPRWRWCIKSGTLTFRRDEHQYVLEGQWSGYIEGYSETTGGCAPGRVYLEKPVLTEKVKVAEQRYTPYNGENQRKVKVARVLEVRNETIRIKVWDNGTVDGDVVTLFLNGKRILNNYRVSKTKWNIPVKLLQENNFLILHAEDLGDISPNTVAVSIDDGTQEQIIILSSNLKESGAVLIKQFRLREGRGTKY